MSSLSELKAIEEQRVADERAAMRAAELARIAASEAEARARSEAAEAKRRREHEELLAIENARVAAEREARLKIEAAEAAERARQQALLAEARLVQEMELRRAEVAKKRPRWMLVTTSIATVVAFVLIYVAVDRTRASEQARTDARLAELQAKEVRRDFAELQGKIAAIETQGAELASRASQLEAALAKAASEAERAEIARRQAKLDADRAAHERRLAEVERLRKKLERSRKIEVSEDCQRNVICK